MYKSKCDVAGSLNINEKMIKLLDSMDEILHHNAILTLDKTIVKNITFSNEVSQLLRRTHFYVINLPI